MGSENNKDLGNDIVKLAKVWNNLSDDMQELLSIAIAGKEYAEGTSELISEIGRFDLDKDFLVRKDESILSAEQINEFKLIESLSTSIKTCIKNVKEVDDAFTDLKKKTDK